MMARWRLRGVPDGICADGQARPRIGVAVFEARCRASSNRSSSAALSAGYAPCQPMACQSHQVGTNLKDILHLIDREEVT